MRKILIPSLIVLGILSRLFAHVPNVVPIGALALFSGYAIKSKFGFAIPLVIMFTSDLVLGFHSTVPYVYGSYVLTSFLGYIVARKVNGVSIVFFSLASSVLFYLITNFGVWVTGTMYTKDLAGLVQCYVYAIPFFRATLIGDMIFNTVIYFGYMKAFSSNKSAVINS